MIPEVSLATILYALYAASFPMAKALFTYVPPLMATGVRLMCAGALLLAYTVMRYGIRYTTSYMHTVWWTIPYLACMNMYLGIGVSDLAIHHISSVEASLIWNLAPCFTALSAYHLYGARYTWTMIAGLCISVTALTPMALYQLHGNTALHASHMLYDIVCFIAMVAYAYGWVFFTLISTRFGNHPALLNSASMLLAGGALVFTHLCIGTWVTQDAANTFSLYEVLPMFVGLLIIVDIVFVNGYSVLLSRISPLIMSMIGLLVPVFTALFSSFVFGVHVPTGFIPTLLWMSVGLSIFHYGEHAKSKANRAT